jgi:hypothetical protein
VRRAAGVFGGVWVVAFSTSTAVLVRSASSPDLSPERPEGPSAPHFVGRLHTRGAGVFDDAERPIRLMGVNVSGMEYGAGRPWTPQGCEDLKHGRRLGCYSAENGPPEAEFERLERWGFNVARLPISWSNLEPDPPTREKSSVRHHYNDSYLGALDELIRNLGSHHLSVVLSMHQWAWSPGLHPEGKNAHTMDHGLGLPAWLYSRGGYDQIRARHDFFTNHHAIFADYSAQAGLVDAWRMVADRYKNTPAVVGADLLNEPYPAMEGQHPQDVGYTLTELVGVLASAVQKADPHLLLIFEDDARTPVTRLPELPNLVLSYHSYPKAWKADGEEKFRKQLDRSRTWNIPLWIGEFQKFGGATPEGWQANLHAMLEDCRRDNVGWAYWAYWRASQPLIGDKERVGESHEDVVQALRAGF